MRSKLPRRVWSGLTARNRAARAPRNQNSTSSHQGPPAWLGLAQLAGHPPAWSAPHDAQAVHGPQPDFRCEYHARAWSSLHIASWDYGLCVRGCGNFSSRLYETLSCGRLPVFVDTDCVLPFDDLIDWREHCWVDIGDVDSLGSIVARFHDGLTDDDFRALQHAARTRWEQWLSPEGVFTNVIRLLG